MATPKSFLLFWGKQEGASPYCAFIYEWKCLQQVLWDKKKGYKENQLLHIIF
jgi:hypothetical protein